MGWSIAVGGPLGTVGRYIGMAVAADFSEELRRGFPRCFVVGAQSQAEDDAFAGLDFADVVGRRFGAALFRIDRIGVAVDDVIVERIFDVRRIVFAAEDAGNDWFRFR